MGALISLYAIIKYPNVFGSAGLFSPALWVSPQLYNDAQHTNFKTIHRFFFYAGQKESETMVSDMKQMEDALYNNNNHIQNTEIIFPLGQHNESYWRKAFPEFYDWLVK
jgi:metallo-beta-lactamase class B